MNQAAKNIMVLVLICCVGCKPAVPEQMGPRDYVRFVEMDEHQLNATIQSGIWNYRFQYKPAAYTALKEQEPDHVEQSGLSKKVALLSHTAWFNIAISVPGSGLDPLKFQARDISDYNYRLDYFLNQAARNFHLYYGSRGEMKQAGYHFENNYNVKPEIVIVVGFEIPDAQPQESLKLEYDDELFNAGILKFNLPGTTLHTIPQLII